MTMFMHPVLFTLENLTKVLILQPCVSKVYLLSLHLPPTFPQVLIDNIQLNSSFIFIKQYLVIGI